MVIYIVSNTQFTSERIKELWRNPEYRKHISECVSQNMKGKKKSPEHIEKLRLSKLGKKLSPETKLKMSLASKGKKKSLEHRLHLSIARKDKYTETNSWNWKGDKTGIPAIHNWISKHWGVASKCEMPGCVYPRMGEKKMLLKPARYEWSNKSGKYLRDRNDWWQLCKSCHLKYDYKNNTHSKNTSAQ